MKVDIRNYGSNVEVFYECDDGTKDHVTLITEDIIMTEGIEDYATESEFTQSIISDMIECDGTPKWVAEAVVEALDERIHDTWVYYHEKR